MRPAAALVGLEGAALVVIALVYGGAGLVGAPFDRTATLLEAVMALVVGLLLLLVARGLSRTTGWARSPAVVAQLLMLPVGVGLVQGRVWWAAVPVLVLAVAVLVALFTPQARAAYADSD
jgi:uncharacterized membrane protein (DUF2068 family)